MSIPKLRYLAAVVAYDYEPKQFESFVYRYDQDDALKYVKLKKDFENTLWNDLGKFGKLFGGCVRDRFNNESPKDFDLLVYSTNLMNGLIDYAFKNRWSVFPQDKPYYNSINRTIIIATRNDIRIKIDVILAEGLLNTIDSMVFQNLDLDVNQLEHRNGKTNIKNSVVMNDSFSKIERNIKAKMFRVYCTSDPFCKSYQRCFSRLYHTHI
jgi:hypothetical protein